MARYGQAYRDRIVARLLPPERSAIDLVSREVGISVSTLERWRADALADGSGCGAGAVSGSQRWTAGARLEAVIVTAAMDEAARSVWCREQGLYPAELDAWQRDAIAGLGEPAGGQCCGGAAGPPTGKGVGAGAASQGQGTGRNGRLACAVKKPARIGAPPV